MKGVLARVVSPFAQASGSPDETRAPRQGEVAVRGDRHRVVGPRHVDVPWVG